MYIFLLFGLQTFSRLIFLGQTLSQQQIICLYVSHWNKADSHRIAINRIDITNLH